eukprot:scaffold159295_cov18-Tisochrysis_lutea.AAC.1
MPTQGIAAGTAADKAPEAQPPAPETGELVAPEQEEEDGDGVRKECSALTSSCVVCFDSCFEKGGFSDRTVLICDQCEREYHGKGAKGRGSGLLNKRRVQAVCEMVRQAGQQGHLRVMCPVHKQLMDSVQIVWEMVRQAGSSTCDAHVSLAGSLAAQELFSKALLHRYFSAKPCCKGNS